MAPIAADYANLRGVNYVPAWANNPVDQWWNYDSAVVEENLDVLAAFGVNAIRTFGHYEVWLEDPIGYRANLEHLVTAASARGILTLLVLFDSVGDEPSGDLNADAQNAGRWIKSPSTAHLMEREFLSNALTYLDETLLAVDDALSASGSQLSTPVIFDAWNEPSGSVATAPFTVLDQILAHVGSAAPFPVTVGFAFAASNGPLLNTLGSVLDVLSFHPYGMFEELVRSEAALARSISSKHGNVPVLATEGAFHGYFQSYAHVLRWFERESLGFFLWEGFVGSSPFVAGGGVFYPRPIVGDQVAVRDLEGANTLLALAVADGFEPAHVGVLLDESDPDYRAYGTVPFGFTTADAHLLLEDWAGSYGVVHPSVQADPAALSFYSVLMVWSAFTLDRLSLAGANLEAKMQLLQQRIADGVVPPIELAFESVAEDVADSMITSSLAEPPSRPPSVVHVGLEVTPSAQVPKVDVRVRVLVLDPDSEADLFGVFLLLFDTNDNYRTSLPLNQIPGSAVHEFTATVNEVALTKFKLLALVVDQAAQFHYLWKELT